MRLLAALSGSLLFLATPPQRAHAAPPGFTEATVAQAVNFVEVISGERARPAQVRDRVTFQEAVRTGAKSRAELVFPDATIARVGANSVFSFRPERRTFDLKQGCVLFHSPKGKGGGQIRTAAVTAAVTGTTIIVAATPNGGFKLLVLEGTALIKLANGTIVKLTAGQMAYVLPGGNTISPPLNFALADQVQGSDLVSGFESVLPSMPLIDAAILQQQLLLQQGELSNTAFLIGQVTGNNLLNLIPVNAPVISSGQNPGSPVEGENTGSSGTPTAPTANTTPPYVPTPYDAMLTDTVVNPLDPNHTIGLYELDTPQNFADFCSTLSNQGVPPPANPFDAGLLARNIDFNDPTVDLAAFNPAAEFVFLAVGEARVHGGLAIQNFGGKVVLKSHLAPVIDSGAIFSIPSPASFSIDSDAAFTLISPQFSVPGGSLSLESSAALTISGGSFQSMYNTDLIAASVNVSGASFQILDNSTPSIVHIDAWDGSGNVSLANITLNSAHLRVGANGSFTLSGASIYDGASLRVNAKTIDVSGISFSPYISELSLKQADPWNLLSPSFTANNLFLGSQSDLNIGLGYFSGYAVTLDGSSSLTLSQTQVYQTYYMSSTDMLLHSYGDVDITTASYLSSTRGINIDGKNVSIDNSQLLTDISYGLGVVINASSLLTLNAADIRPRDTISLTAASIDSTAGTFQTSIGGIFADATSDISVDGGTWTAAANLEFAAPSITTIGMYGTASQGIDFDGDNTSVTGGSLSAPNSAGWGIWIRGDNVATVDGATLSAARDINIHGGQIDLINASVTVNHPSDPMPQIFVKGTGPVTLNAANLSGTGPVNIEGATLNLLNGQVTSGTMTGYDQIHLNATAANGLLNVKGTTFASPQIRMQADTIRLENINFPNGSMVDLDSRLGILAPNANTRQPIMPGAVNYFDGVQYDGTLLGNTPHPNINIH